MDSNTAARRLTRREREAARHRAEILETAEAVFAEYGFEAARMDEIARRAEFSVGTLYRFFESKEQLYEQLLAAKFDHIESIVQAAIAEGVSPLDKIRRMFVARLDLFWAHQSFFQLLVRETTDPLCASRPRWAPYIIERYSRFMEQLRGIFEQGIETGEFKDVGGDALVLSIEGVLRAYFTRLSHQSNGPTRDSNEEEQLLRLFLHGALKDE